MKHLYLISVHDEDGNTIVSGEASSANEAMGQIVEIERHLHEMEKEVSVPVGLTEDEI